jgi:hypothetical protein
MEHLSKFPRIGTNFPAFFGAFLSVMRTDMVIRLGRIYDPEGTGHDSCTLVRCLSVLRDNPQFFTNAAIEERLTQGYRDANRDFLLHHRVDPKQAEADIRTVKNSRERLISLRHKLYAHKDLETVLSGNKNNFLSTHVEITLLIHMAHEIWNRYSKMWNALTCSEKTIGEDDYKWLFRCLRRGMKLQDALDARKTRRFFARARRTRPLRTLTGPQNLIEL